MRVHGFKFFFLWKSFLNIYAHVNNMIFLVMSWMRDCQVYTTDFLITALQTDSLLLLFLICFLTCNHVSDYNLRIEFWLANAALICLDMLDLYKFANILNIFDKFLAGKSFDEYVTFSKSVIRKITEAKNRNSIFLILRLIDTPLENVLEWSLKYDKKKIRKSKLYFWRVQKS